MNRLAPKVLLLCAALIFIGAGCGDSDEVVNTPTDQPTDTQQEQQPTPPQSPETLQGPLSELQKSYIKCINDGSQPSLKFDDRANGTKLFCIVEDTIECDAIEFLNDTCPTEKDFQDANEQILVDQSCTLDINPVCGDDGYSYANRCIATLQNVTILHEGKCDPSNRPQPSDDTTTDPETPDPVPLPPSNNTPGNNDTTQPPATNPNGDPLWLDVLTDLARQEANSQHTTIESCSINGKQMYLKAGNCPTCFSILYNKKGNVSCFPDNDLRGNCPGNFSLANKASQCRIITSL